MLTVKQSKAVELMLTGKHTLKDISSELGVSVSTLSRWKRNPEFKREYSERLSEILSDAAAKAFRTVTDIMQNSDSDTSRLSAAKDLLDRAGFKPKDISASKTDMNLCVTVSYRGEDDGENTDAEQ